MKYTSSDAGVPGSEHQHATALTLSKWQSPTYLFIKEGLRDFVWVNQAV
jgi:hypothetical protein